VKSGITLQWVTKEKASASLRLLAPIEAAIAAAEANAPK
jgi:hypothetical protein